MKKKFVKPVTRCLPTSTSSIIAASTPTVVEQETHVDDGGAVRMMGTSFEW